MQYRLYVSEFESLFAFITMIAKRIKTYNILFPKIMSPLRGYLLFTAKR
jgi:hypothetical protein